MQTKPNFLILNFIMNWAICLNTLQLWDLFINKRAIYLLMKVYFLMSLLFLLQNKYPIIITAIITIINIKYTEKYTIIQ